MSEKASLSLLVWQQNDAVSKGLMGALKQAEARGLIGPSIIRNQKTLEPVDLGDQQVSAIICIPEGNRLTPSIVEALNAFEEICPVLIAGPSIKENESQHMGLYHVLAPPFAATSLVRKIEAVMCEHEVRKALVLKQKLAMRSMIGRSDVFEKVRKRTLTLAGYDVSVLISGETGTGKEVCARTLHYLSGRAGGPFIPINCGAVPDNLIENELFGHEKGSYTGAEESRQGLVAAAHQGTLFLDEVDALPATAQVKLLRFLQEHEYRPIGATETRKADVRILAASNMNLEEAVIRGRIRDDLYFRLNVVSLRLPPLRERPEDIPPLARHFLKKCCHEFNKEDLILGTASINTLMTWDWPGNIRELEHVMRRAVVLCDGRQIEPEHLELEIQARAQETLREAKARVVSTFEKSYINRALARHCGNITQAAKSAGKNRRAFFELIRKHHINPEQFRSI